MGHRLARVGWVYALSNCSLGQYGCFQERRNCSVGVDHPTACNSQKGCSRPAVQKNEVFGGTGARFPSAGPEWEARAPHAANEAYCQEDENYHCSQTSCRPFAEAAHHQTTGSPWTVPEIERQDTTNSLSKVNLAALSIPTPFQ